jgi:hypothetical protein
MQGRSTNDQNTAATSIGRPSAAIIVAIGIQVAAVVVFLFGDADRMFPGGRFGLHWPHHLLAMAAYPLALPVGLIVSAAYRRWLLLVAQLTILVVAILIQTIMAMPPPVVNAADFQHLVGQPRSAMDEELGPDYTSGWGVSPSKGSYDSHYYNGLTVYVDKSTQIIDSIEPNSRAAKR